ncbi:hypothetical protein [Mesorhizobium cantuariense]|uniref:Uncharacterized protein n=1 Tax=Mesorhizobium cantuariense TaxID=1300275 RepID=A0ABV7MHR2_9HYPH
MFPITATGFNFLAMERLRAFQVVELLLSRKRIDHFDDLQRLEAVSRIRINWPLFENCGSESFELELVGIRVTEHWFLVARLRSPEDT